MAWPGLLILLAVFILLPGCKNYGPIGTAGFDPTYSRTLEKNERLLFSTNTNLVDGTYMEGEEEAYPYFSGVLLLTEERMLFAMWNEKQQRYEPSFWTGYLHIAQVKMHNNILLQYIAIVAKDGRKFTYMLNRDSVDPAYAILMERIGDNHKIPVQSGPNI